MPDDTSRGPDIRACVFDAYGTVFDINAAAERARPRLGDAADALSAAWRAKQMEYTWLMSLMGRHVDFWSITGWALDYALDQTGIPPAGLRDELMDQYRVLDAYPDARATLQTLKRAGLATAILSNGTPDMLHSATENAGLRDLLDLVLSVESVGIFKPHPKVYQLAVDRLGVDRRQICFVSSNGWDVAGAASFGFRVVWVNRVGRPTERLPTGPEAALPDLSALPGLIGLASSSQP